MIPEQMQWMRSNEGIEVERFKQKLEEWSGKCPASWDGETPYGGGPRRGVTAEANRVDDPGCNGGV